MLRVSASKLNLPITSENDESGHFFANFEHLIVVIMENSPLNCPYGKWSLRFHSNELGLLMKGLKFSLTDN